MIIYSCAKVNIGLSIYGRRSDGYHLISTVFQELDFCDKIEIFKTERGCDFSSNVCWLGNDDSNLCVIAFHKMKERFPSIKGIKINLTKRIPPGSGLGGGSSNAAAIINGLNKIYRLNLKNRDREVIAEKIGADVPFFIKGMTQLGAGTGNKLSGILKPFKGIYLLVFSKVKISTTWAYDQIRKKNLGINIKKPKFDSIFREGNFSYKIFKNDFEKVIFPAYPEIGQIKSSLFELGAEFASLSGSGSTVFGIFKDKSVAIKAQSFLKSSYNTILAYPQKK